MAYASQGISFKPEYFTSPPGILKIIELLCDLLATILAGAPPTYDGTSGHKGFFLFVSIVALLITLVLLILALLNMHNAFSRIPWSYIEIFSSAGISLFYFIASIVIATIAKFNGAYGAAAFFGFAAMLTYLVDVIYQYRAKKNTEQSQNVQQFGPSQGGQQFGYGQNPQQFEPSQGPPSYPPNMSSSTRPQQTY